MYAIRSYYARGPNTMSPLTVPVPVQLATIARGRKSSMPFVITSYSIHYTQLYEASPHSPLPAGYVTLPVNSRPPPLGLRLFHSEESGI